MEDILRNDVRPALNLCMRSLLAIEPTTDEIMDVATVLETTLKRLDEAMVGQKGRERAEIMTYDEKLEVVYEVLKTCEKFNFNEAYATVEQKLKTQALERVSTAEFWTIIGDSKLKSRFPDGFFESVGQDSLQ